MRRCRTPQRTITFFAMCGVSMYGVYKFDTALLPYMDERRRSLQAEKDLVAKARVVRASSRASPSRAGSRMR